MWTRGSEELFFLNQWMEIQKILFVSKWRQNWSVDICFRTVSKQTEPHGGSRGPCSWAWAARKHARHPDLYSYFCSLLHSDCKNCLSDPVCKLCFQSSPSIFWRAYADSLFIYSLIAHVPFLFYAAFRKTLHSSLHWVSASLVVDAVWVRGIERLTWTPAGHWLSPRCCSLGILWFFTSAIPSEFIPIRHNNDDYLRWLAVSQGAKNSHHIWSLEISTCPRLLKCPLCVQHRSR